MTTSSDVAVASPREVAELLRRTVAGTDGIVFADLFAADGVLEYPFAALGMPERLEGREAIRAFFDRAPASRDLFSMDGVTAVVHDTGDPEVIIAEIEHHGTSKVTGRPYRAEALGVVRVRNGEIVAYRDYMNPLQLAELIGQLPQLVTTLTEQQPA